MIPGSNKREAGVSGETEKGTGAVRGRDHEPRTAGGFQKLPSIPQQGHNSANSGLLSQ